MCNRPITAYIPTIGDDRRPRFKMPTDTPFKEVQIPCGTCQECLKNKANQWAIRCCLEAANQETLFLTLTYDEEHKPEGLQKRDLQLFFKKLRKAGFTFRYFACGEYGERTYRPHYHIILFGGGFPLKIFRKTAFGYSYQSPAIGKAWPYGFHLIEDFNYQTAFYVANYGQKSQGINAKCFEKLKIEKPFLLMSRKPGLGWTWLNEHKEDLTKKRQIIFKLTEKIRRAPLPRYYKNKLDIKLTHDEKLKAKAFAQNDAWNRNLSIKEAGYQKEALQKAKKLNSLCEI